MLENFPGKHHKNGQQNDQTERARGLGSKTRKEIGKRNQKTALGFQAGRKTSDIPSLPAGVWKICFTVSSSLEQPSSQGDKTARCSPLQHPVHSHVGGGGQQKFPRKRDPRGVGVIVLEDLHQKEDEDRQQEALACSKHTWKKRVTPSAGVIVQQEALACSKHTWKQQSDMISRCRCAGRLLPGKGWGQTAGSSCLLQTHLETREWYHQQVSLCSRNPFTAPRIPGNKRVTPTAGVTVLEDPHQKEDEDRQQEALACSKHTWKKRGWHDQQV